MTESDSDHGLYLLWIGNLVRDSSATGFWDFIFTVSIVYGVYKMIKVLWSILKLCHVHQCRARCQKKDRLYRRFGLSKEERSWAVVTGGSDGIGYGMAKDLAINSGFNICIIARNEQKMKDKLEKITQLAQAAGHTNFKTKYVIADFGKMFTMQNYVDTLTEPLKDLDIGMLILNAGIGNMGPFDWLSNDEVQNTVQINVHHVVYTAKALVSQMLKRVESTGTKAGIIVVSSGAALTPCAGFAVYSATKVFGDYIARALYTEYKGQIDVMSYNPNMVDTNFSKDEEGKAKLRGNPFYITPELAAHSCFRDFGGYDNYTRGAFFHKVELIPDKQLQNIMLNMSKEQFTKEHPNDEHFKKM